VVFHELRRRPRPCPITMTWPFLPPLGAKARDRAVCVSQPSLTGGGRPGRGVESRPSFRVAAAIVSTGRSDGLVRRRSHRDRRPGSEPGRSEHAFAYLPGVALIQPRSAHRGQLFCRSPPCWARCLHCGHPAHHREGCLGFFCSRCISDTQFRKYWRCAAALP
jgi:hypothetical protein